MRLLPILLMCCVLLATAGPAQARLKATSGDPMVLLEEAKLEIADGKLAHAQELLAAIPLDDEEEYVNQEVLFQRMLLSASLLQATDFLLKELVNAELFESGYADYLVDERSSQAALFEETAARFIELSGTDPELEFVRFRLPFVTIEHLRDVELYSDVEMLKAAADSWSRDQQRLGKGLINAQARVALVLICARYYDLEQASISIEAVSLRLLEGVPVDMRETVSWISEFAFSVANPADGLEELSRIADASLNPEAVAEPAAPVEESSQLKLKPAGSGKLRRGNKQSNDTVERTSD
ncbi:MAG: hypothetical protein H7A35_08365 [Planctomycetales bacterium]|nr:hypothetical protein [bacterium]UNM06899.1 MAG: hypothetical protein H7A35_08365 [Planctomycetales bacterium]